MSWEIQLACVQLTDRHTHAYTLTNNRAGSEQGCTEFCDLWGFSHSLVVLQLPGATGFDLIKGFVSWEQERGGRKRVRGRCKTNGTE